MKPDNPDIDNRQHRARERLEAHLYSAADFEPEGSEPVGFATRALAQHRACRSHNHAIFVSGMGIAATALVLLTAWAMQGRKPNRVGGHQAIKIAATHARSVPADTENAASYPANEFAATRARSVPEDTETGAIEQAVGAGRPGAFVAAASAARGKLSAPVVLPQATDAEEVIRPRRRRRHHVAVAPPRVRWHDETVAEYRAGVIAPAWIVQRDDEHDAVVATPVMIDIPLQSGEIPMTNSAPDTTRLTLIDYSSDTYQDSQQETQENP